MQVKLSFRPLNHGQKQRFLGVRFVNTQFQSQSLPLDLITHISLRCKYTVSVVHVVELEVLLDQRDQFLPIFSLEKFLAFDILPMKWWNLNIKQNCTFFSVLGSSTILKTLDLIWARMFDNCPFASKVWITKFLSSLSSYINYQIFK